MVAAQRGYRCVFVMPDKMSREKIALLRAFGAEVVVCPTEVEPEDPRSYYSVSRRLAEETPGAFNPNQYSNPANPQAHYDTTGPEIWEQLGDELDVLVPGVGTGGTVPGTGHYLKERKPGLQIVGADPIGSIYSSEQVHSYLSRASARISGRRRSTASVVDRWIRVSDREAFAATRRVAREEGILIGASGGMALHAALSVAAELPPERTVLVILPDGGRPYLSKVFNDDWMLVHGMFDDAARPPTAGELVAARSGDVPALLERRDPSSRWPTRSRCCSASASRSCPVIAEDGDVVGLRPRAHAARPRDARRARSTRGAHLRADERSAADRAVGAAPRRRLPRPAVEPGRARRRRHTPVGVLTRADVLEWLAHA